jgi:hypothetical protein
VAGQVGHRAVADGGAAAGVAAPLIPPGVEADRGEPRPDVIGPPPPGGEGAQVGVLHDVGRISRVRGQPQRQGLQQVGMRQRRRQELLMVACPAFHLPPLTTPLLLGDALLATVIARPGFTARSHREAGYVPITQRAPQLTGRIAGERPS